MAIVSFSKILYHYCHVLWVRPGMIFFLLLSDFLIYFFCPLKNQIFFDKIAWKVFSSSFRERSNFPQIWFWDLRFRIWGLEIKHLKAHNFVWQGCFFFHYYLATSTTNWAQIFTGLLFYAYVEIHQVRRLVFDNYQQCPVSSTKVCYCLQICRWRGDVVHHGNSWLHGWYGEYSTKEV